MKISFLLSIAVLFGANAARADVVCDVETYKDAQACMRKVAASLDEYEDPNTPVTSYRTDLLVEVLKGIREGRWEISIAKASDFAGAVISHQDEHHIFYYGIKKGRNTKPVLIYDLNLVDLGWMLSIDKNLDPNSVLARPNTYLFGLRNLYDIKEILEEQIQEAITRKIP